MPHSQKIRRGSIKKRKGVVPSLASSMRRSSIGLPLRPSYSQDGGDDMTFDDAFFDGDGASEEPESPRRGFEQRQQTPRGSHVNVIQDGDDESVLEAPSKGKEKATNENHDGGNVEKEISQGLENVDTQRRNEDDEATPKKKPTKKRSRKKRGLLQNDVGGCFGIRPKRSNSDCKKIGSRVARFPNVLLSPVTRLVNHHPAANNNFFFTKVLGDGDYIATGQLRILHKKHKLRRTTKDNTYVFDVIEGAVTFKVHKSSCVQRTYHDLWTLNMTALKCGASLRKKRLTRSASCLQIARSPRPQRRSYNLGQAPMTARLSGERALAAKRAASAKA